MWKRILFVSLAAACLLLGAVGVLLPGLPTTPFLLLASYLLVRSYPTLNDRLLRSPLFGQVLRDWQQRGGVQQHVRVKAIVFVIAVVGLSLWLGRLSGQMLAVILIAAAAGLLVILRLPPARNDRPAERSDRMD